MHNYKLVIFDWDGTLMDSVACIVSSVQATAKLMNMEPPTFEQAKQIIVLQYLLKIMQETLQQLAIQLAKLLK